MAATAKPRRGDPLSKWFERHKRVYLLDFQMPDSADQMPIGQARNLRAVDPADMVRRLHRAGVQALYVHAKDNQGNCYYDTAYGHKHSAIGDRDLMREFSVACRAVGMTVLYYVQTSPRAPRRPGGLVRRAQRRRQCGGPHQPGADAAGQGGGAGDLPDRSGA